MSISTGIVTGYKVKQVGGNIVLERTMDKKMTFQEYKEYRKAHPVTHTLLAKDELAADFGFTSIRTPTMWDRIKCLLHLAH